MSAPAMLNRCRNIRKFANCWLSLSRSSSNIIDPPDNPNIMIPPYVPREGEEISMKKARLVYQSRKRGMLENDLLLSTFAAKYLKDMNEEQVDQYDQLINQPSNDWEIYYWATEMKPTPPEFDSKIMDMFKEHVKNIKKEKRIRQPDLY